VNLWCRSWRLAGAYQESTPDGDYWLIPERALGGIVVRGHGRPPKAKPAQPSTNSKKRGGRK